MKKEEPPLCHRCKTKMEYEARIVAEDGYILVPADWKCPKCGKTVRAIE